MGFQWRPGMSVVALTYTNSLTTSHVQFRTEAVLGRHGSPRPCAIVDRAEFGTTNS